MTQRRTTDLPKLRAFVSFCTAFDDGMLAALDAQAAQAHSPFDIAAYSIEASRFTEWEGRTRALIRDVDLVIVLIGTMVDSRIVDEVDIARSLGKPVLALLDDPGDPRVDRLALSASVNWTESDLFALVRKYAKRANRGQALNRPDRRE